MSTTDTLADRLLALLQRSKETRSGSLVTGIPEAEFRVTAERLAAVVRNWAGNDVTLEGELILARDHALAAHDSYHELRGELRRTFTLKDGAILDDEMRTIGYESDCPAMTRALR